ncbi:DEAD/DEAH box helicase [Marinospirillum insulare]|uniref:ATP-dependent RNA helicase RhlE n=1 Tax=Marinospirillum insulare TaxID=217169 RepID=A0ABQ5ZTY8_9GAMM|nr:DEAD/DEAH box helicase [Marinospirillum insulare]GLR62891.1 ATP-dependent RNA helicase RhlE [Marinospirillum insulare]
MSFSTLGLSAPILDALKEQGYTRPTPIQAQAIPAILAGKDVMAAAQTGTGKTAGFTLPILERLAAGKPATANQARALILTPTRELAAQVAESVATYSQGLKLTSTVVFGGVKINPQMMKLRKGVDILVATPGRLMDLYNQNAVKFSKLEVLVLDEADRMLDMGFIHDIKKILKILPPKRQNLLFSATFSNDIRKLARGLVNNPVEVSVTPPNAAAPSVEQKIYKVEKAEKAALLVQLIKDHNWFQVLVFTKTKHGANKLTQQLEASGFQAAAIHGNKSQGARTKALTGFKDGSVQVLVATDIAARGLDIDQLPQVVNYELPNVAEDYVHRIGRTGRAGSTGQAISLVSKDEVKLLRDIERLIKKALTVESLPEFNKTLAKLPPRNRSNNQPRKNQPSAPGQKPAARKPRSKSFGSKKNYPKKPGTKADN